MEYVETGGTLAGGAANAESTRTYSLTFTQQSNQVTIDQTCPPQTPAGQTLTVAFGTAGDLLRIDQFPSSAPATFKRRSP